MQLQSLCAARASPTSKQTAPTKDHGVCATVPRTPIPSTARRVTPRKSHGVGASLVCPLGVVLCFYGRGNSGGGCNPLVHLPSLPTSDKGWSRHTANWTLDSSSSDSMQLFSFVSGGSGLRPRQLSYRTEEIDRSERRWFVREVFCCTSRLRVPILAKDVSHLSPPSHPTHKRYRMVQAYRASCTRDSRYIEIILYCTLVWVMFRCQLVSRVS